MCFSTYTCPIFVRVVDGTFRMHLNQLHSAMSARRMLLLAVVGPSSQ